jgi:hypothetical protein
LSDELGVISLAIAQDNALVEHCGVTEEDASGFWLTTNTIGGKYLWLVRPDDVKIALEHGKLRRRVTNGPLKHTNLTGGVAHCGGELWFEDDVKVYVNGGSGRFRPRGGSELDAVVSALASAGYTVCSFGWNYETNRERRSLRAADIKWL